MADIKNVILDTDIGPDCDDAAALALTTIIRAKAARGCWA